MFDTWTSKINLGGERETVIDTPSLLLQGSPWARSLLPDWGITGQLPWLSVCKCVRLERCWKRIILSEAMLTQVLHWQTDLWKNVSRHHRLSPVVSAGPPSWDDPVLLRPADWRRLRGSTGSGIPLSDPSAGPGTGCILSPGPTPPAGPVLHPIQPGCVQEPASRAAPWAGHWLLRWPRWSRWHWQGKGVGVREEKTGKKIRCGCYIVI